MDIMGLLSGNGFLIAIGIGAAVIAWPDLQKLYAQYATGGKTPEESELNKAIEHFNGLVQYQIKHGNSDSLTNVLTLAPDLKCSKHVGCQCQCHNSQKG